jgi:F-type H+-transporting ATPase subunit gamma
MVQRADIKRVGYIIVSSDRGLAGGLNNNLFRKLLVEIRGWQEKGVESRRRHHRPEGQRCSSAASRSTCSARSPTWATSRKVEQLIGVIKVMLDAYTAGKLDRVFLVYNDFVNTMTQKRPSTSCCRCRRRRRGAKHDWDYLYEPDARPCWTTC